jgi:hypothetical protein
MTTQLAIPAVGVVRLAHWQAHEQGARDAGTIFVNLYTARELGTLWVDAVGPNVTGHVGFIRVSRRALEEIEQQGRRVFFTQDHDPDGNVCLLIEQMTVLGLRAIRARLRRLSALPGVEYVAGWRGHKMHLHPTRRH